MPFIANRKDTGKRVDITEIENPRLELKSDDCICQSCGRPLMIKAGMIVAPHFAHYAKCDGKFESHPESPEHRAAKQFLAKHLPKEFSEYTSATLQFEVPIEMPWRSKGRIADLLVTFPMGWRIAHEVQLAAITVEELEKRTNDYQRAGIDVIWWLGRSADTEANHQYCLKQFGLSFSITINLDDQRRNRTGPGIPS